MNTITQITIRRQAIIKCFERRCNQQIEIYFRFDLAVATADRKEYTKKEKGCVGNSTQPLLKIVNTSLLAPHLCNSPFLGPAEPAKPLCGPRHIIINAEYLHQTFA